MKYIYIGLGSIALGLAYLGIVTPGIPVTPFVLLAGFFYAKGSPKLYKKLENNKIIGRYLERVKNGLTFKQLLLSIAFMWCMVCFTSFVVFPYGKMRFIMLGLGVIGTIAQWITLRKRKPSISKVKV